MCDPTGNAGNDSSERGGIGQYDELSLWRCPQLGGPVTFAYCRQMNRSLPCSRTATCWGERFDVEGFLREYYDEHERSQIEASSGRGRMDIISETLGRVLSRRGDAQGEAGAD
jgi:hypothetical protein